MTKKLKLLSSSFIMALTLAAPLATYAMEPEDDHKAAHTSKHFNLYTYLRVALDLDQPILEAIYHHTPELHPNHPNHYVYKKFLTGKLIYKPDPKSNWGMVVMPIADLPNPLNGKFDLSKCGDAGKRLSINTGYRKGQRPENKDKAEIWIAPRFLIEKNLQGSASHFKDIMGSWDARTAPVGMFWTWSNWDVLKYYDYATTLSWESYNDPENNLRKIHHTMTQEIKPLQRFSLHALCMSRRHFFFMSFFNSLKTFQSTNQ